MADKRLPSTNQLKSDSVEPRKNVSEDNSGNKGAKPNAINFHPDIPRRSMEMPGNVTIPDRALSINSDDNQLTVGRNIALSGKIDACEKLVVEGTVEATLNKALAIEVAHGGVFKGKAEVLEAKISGKFQGTLTAKELLTIHKGGHIEGSVRYGRIIIESGGEITGDMASLEETEKQTGKK